MLAEVSIANADSSASKAALALARFPERLQPALAAFAATSVAQRDLLLTFPAAAVILVSRRRSSARELALARLNAGASLKEVAALVQLPLWLRALPPEALHHRLPVRIGAADGDQSFGMRIANAVPACFHPASPWLTKILEARRRGGDRFALWLASQLRTRCHDISPTVIRVLAAYAFFSERPYLRGGRCISHRWNSSIALETAVETARAWLIAVLSEIRASSMRTFPCWSQSLIVHGYKFVPLATAAELQEEGAAMRNCLASYARRVLLRKTLIFSVRHKGRRVATLELRPGHLDVAQLKGPGNEAVADDVWQAVRAWRDVVSARPDFFPSRQESVDVDKELWRSVWEPYWSEFGAFRLIGPNPPADCCTRLLAPMQTYLSHNNASLAALRAAIVGRRPTELVSMLQGEDR